MGGVGWVACQSFLVREAVSVFWWVELDFFPLECNQVSSNELCQWFWSNFGQPVYCSSGLYSCVAGEFAWYFVLWALLALGWCLVSV